MMVAIHQQCPVCGSRDLNPFLEYRGVPANIGILYTDRETAIQCPKGDIRLAWCNTCGFITNLLFDSGQMNYCLDYDNNLFFSPLYQAYARSSAIRLIERYGLRNKSVIGIGCGKGDFLYLLCELGNNRGTGFDPSFDPALFGLRNTDRITFIQDFYSEKYSGYQADLLSCRYVFEHIPDPVSFLEMVRRAIGLNGDSVVHFEVPNILSILRQLSGWDIIYEHCSYFSRYSLANVFSKCGYSVLSIEETFDDQYLQIEAKTAQEEEETAGPRKEEMEELALQIVKFKRGFEEKMDAWRKCVADLKNTGRRTAIWGAGAKGVSFLNMLPVQDGVAYAIDINPQKRSMHIPGTGHMVLNPSDCINDPPDTIIVMNKIYLEEIRMQIEHLGFSPQYLLV
jgi:SAM-dependent methyltransferase